MNTKLCRLLHDKRTSERGPHDACSLTTGAHTQRGSITGPIASFRPLAKRSGAKTSESTFDITVRVQLVESHSLATKKHLA